MKIQNKTLQLLLISIVFFSIFDESSSQRSKFDDAFIEPTGFEKFQSHAGTYLGITNKIDNNVTSPWSFGFNYRYKLPYLNESTAVGIFAEYIADTYGEFLLGGSMTLATKGGIRYTVAPGFAYLQTPYNIVKIRDANGNEIPFTSNDKINEFSFLLRLGISYPFYLDEFFVSPTLNTDFIMGRFFVSVGLNIGLGFE